MRLLLDSIHDAVKKDCLVPALMTALTIPDAMGQFLYPEPVHKKEDCGGNHKKDVGKQYAR